MYSIVDKQNVNKKLETNLLLNNLNLFENNQKNDVNQLNNYLLNQTASNKTIDLKLTQPISSQLQVKFFI